MKQTSKHTIKSNNGIKAASNVGTNKEARMGESISDVSVPVKKVFQQTFVKAAAVTATMAMALIIKIRRNKNRLRMNEYLLDFEYNF